MSLSTNPTTPCCHATAARNTSNSLPQLAIWSSKYPTAIPPPNAHRRQHQHTVGQQPSNQKHRGKMSGNNQAIENTANIGCAPLRGESGGYIQCAGYRMPWRSNGPCNSAIDIFINFDIAIDREFMNCLRTKPTQSVPCLAHIKWAFCNV
ncbi:hypothetical protein LguiB_008990 [Lonicera macranthoides]